MEKINLWEEAATLSPVSCTGVSHPPGSPNQRWQGKDLEVAVLVGAGAGSVQCGGGCKVWSGLVQAKVIYAQTKCQKAQTKSESE